MSKKVLRMITRGAFIVFEGCDRCGKSTQSRKLVKILNQRGYEAKSLCFPDRQTRIGSAISDYLEKKSELEDHAVHLLFSANRWESVSKMKELLLGGTTLVVDRYAYSGVAFTAAKQGLSLDWCKQPDVGLPKPDLVIYLDLKPEELAKRKDFGDERYEKIDFQMKVAKNYELLKEKSWKELDAGRTIEDLHSEILTISENVIKGVKNKEIGTLWTEKKTTTIETRG